MPLGHHALQSKPLLIMELSCTWRLTCATDSFPKWKELFPWFLPQPRGVRSLGRWLQQDDRSKPADLGLSPVHSSGVSKVSPCLITEMTVSHKETSSHQNFQA